MFSLDLSKVSIIIFLSKLHAKGKSVSRHARDTKNVLSSGGWRPLKAPFFSPRVVVVLKVGKERTTTPRANDEDVIIVVVVVVDRQERDERDDPPPRRSETWSGLWKFSRKRQKARNLEGGVK